MKFKLRDDRSIEKEGKSRRKSYEEDKCSLNLLVSHYSEKGKEFAGNLSWQLKQEQQTSKTIEKLTSFRGIHGNYTFRPVIPRKVPKSQNLTRRALQLNLKFSISDGRREKTSWLSPSSV